MRLHCTQTGGLLTNIKLIKRNMVVPPVLHKTCDKLTFQLLAPYNCRQMLYCNPVP